MQTGLFHAPGRKLASRQCQCHCLSVWYKYGLGFGCISLPWHLLMVAYSTKTDEQEAASHKRVGCVVSATCVVQGCTVAIPGKHQPWLVSELETAELCQHRAALELIRLTDGKLTCLGTDCADTTQLWELKLLAGNVTVRIQQVLRYWPGDVKSSNTLLYCCSRSYVGQKHPGRSKGRASNMNMSPKSKLHVSAVFKIYIKPAFVPFDLFWLPGCTENCRKEYFLQKQLNIIGLLTLNHTLKLRI